jgi:hypothetical protein
MCSQSHLTYLYLFVFWKTIGYCIRYQRFHPITMVIVDSLLLLLIARQPSSWQLLIAHKPNTRPARSTDTWRHIRWIAGSTRFFFGYPLWFLIPDRSELLVEKPTSRLLRVVCVFALRIPVRPLLTGHITIGFIKTHTTCKPVTGCTWGQCPFSSFRPVPASESIQGICPELWNGTSLHFNSCLSMQTNIFVIKAVHGSGPVPATAYLCSGLHHDKDQENREKV